MFLLFDVTMNSLFMILYNIRLYSRIIKQDSQRVVGFIRLQFLMECLRFRSLELFL